MNVNLQLNSPKEMAKSSVKWFVMLTLLALTLRFLFRLFGADGGGDGFVGWLYDTSAVLLQPFRAVFADAAVRSNHAFEFQTLFAMVAYMGLGSIATGLIERWSLKK